MSPSDQGPSRPRAHGGPGLLLRPVLFAIACFAPIVVAAIDASVVKAQTPPQDFRLIEGWAGSVAVGMTFAEVVQLFGASRARPVYLDSKGRSPAIEIDVPGGSARPSLVAEVSQGPCGVFAIHRITVRDRMFRTGDGLGVGSTLADLRRASPSIRISHEEGVWAIMADAKIAFGFRGRAVADDDKVTHIRLWLDADTVREQRCPGR